MAGKGFNLFDECPARCIYFAVLSGKRGALQSKPTEINKSVAIAKVRLLVGHL